MIKGGYFGEMNIIEKSDTNANNVNIKIKHGPFIKNREISQKYNNLQCGPNVQIIKLPFLFSIL